MFLLEQTREKIKDDTVIQHCGQNSRKIERFPRNSCKIAQNYFQWKSFEFAVVLNFVINYIHLGLIVGPKALRTTNVQVILNTIVFGEFVDFFNNLFVSFFLRLEMMFRIRIL